jgi:hypothetical protein
MPPPRWSREELVHSSLAVIQKRIDMGKRYHHELHNLRGIEKRLGFSGVTEEVAALAKAYEESRRQARI